MKMNFDYFQIQKWMLETVRLEKIDEKNWIICLVSMFFSWVMVLKLSKKVQFLQFCADLTKKSKSNKAIYIYACERSRYALSENGIVYYTMTYCFGGIRVWRWKVLLNFCWVSIFFDILIANISWMVAHISMNHIIFWKSLMITFRCIWLALTDLVFLLMSAQNCKKWIFFDNWRTVTQEVNKETRQMTPFLSSTFSALTVCNIHFCIWK